MYIDICNFHVKKNSAILLMILLCPVQGPWASSYVMSRNLKSIFVKVIHPIHFTFYSLTNYPLLKHQVIPVIIGSIALPRIKIFRMTYPILILSRLPKFFYHLLPPPPISCIPPNLDARTQPLVFFKSYITLPPIHALFYRNEGAAVV